MSVALAAVAFAPGLAIGSFLNVVAARVPLKRSIVSPRLGVHELRRRRWRGTTTCRSSPTSRSGAAAAAAARGIGLVYPAVELLTALLIAACFFAFGWSGEAFVAAFFCAVLVAISAIDLSHRIVPNVIVLPAAAIVLVAQTALEPSVEWLLGAFGASFFLFLAALAYPKGMGMGDVKLALLLGAMLGRTVPVGADARDGRRARAVDRAPGPARQRGPEDGDPVRAFPRLRRHRRAVLRRPPARRVPDAALSRGP